MRDKSAKWHFPATAVACLPLGLWRERIDKHVSRQPPEKLAV